MRNLSSWWPWLGDKLVLLFMLGTALCYPVWIFAVGGGGYFDPDLLLLLTSGVILIYPVETGFWGIEMGRSLLRREARKKSTWSTGALRLTALAAQLGAMILPKILLPHLIFHGQRKMPLIIWGLLPSPQLCCLLLAVLAGAALGGAALGGLVNALELATPPPPTYNVKRPPATPGELAGNLGFCCLQWLPQLYLLDTIVAFDQHDIGQRYVSSLAVLGMALVFLGLRYNWGGLIHSAFSKQRITPKTAFATQVAWVCGAPLAWWLCGGHITLQALIHHQMSPTPWMARRLFLTWGIEGLVGACGLACGVEAWMKSRSGLPSKTVRVPR